MTLQDEVRALLAADEAEFDTVEMKAYNALHTRAPDLLATLCDKLDEAERECDRLDAERVAFTAALGYGDDVSDPAAELADLIEPVKAALEDANLHWNECPRRCEECGHQVAFTECEHCHGSGCGPGTASGAYEECEWCGGAGWLHDGCTGETYQEVAARAEKAEAAIERVRAITSEHPGSAWDSGLKLKAKVLAALDGEENLGRADATHYLTVDGSWGGEPRLKFVCTAVKGSDCHKRHPDPDAESWYLNDPDLIDTDECNASELIEDRGFEYVTVDEDDEFGMIPVHVEWDEGLILRPVAPHPVLDVGGES